jgi:hypothetical protein
MRYIVVTYFMTLASIMFVKLNEAGIDESVCGVMAEEC